MSCDADGMKVGGLFAIYELLMRKAHATKSGASFKCEKRTKVHRLAVANQKRVIENGCTFVVPSAIDEAVAGRWK